MQTVQPDDLRHDAGLERKEAARAKAAQKDKEDDEGCVERLGPDEEGGEGDEEDGEGPGGDTLLMLAFCR